MMQVLPNLLTQAAAEPRVSPKGAPEGFAKELEARTGKSEASPGPEPPPKAPPPANNTKGGEVAKKEPNAHSQKPDSQPKKSERDNAQPVAAGTADASGLAVAVPAIGVIQQATDPSNPGRAATGPAVAVQAIGIEPQTADQANAVENGANVPTTTDGAANPTTKNLPALIRANGTAVVINTPAAGKSRLTRTGDMPVEPSQAKGPSKKLPTEMTDALKVDSVTVEQTSTGAAAAKTEPDATQPNTISADKSVTTTAVGQHEVERAQQGSGTSHGQQPSADQDEKPTSKTHGVTPTNPPTSIDDPADDKPGITSKGAQPQSPNAGSKMDATPIVQPIQGTKQGAPAAQASTTSRVITDSEIKNVIRTMTDRIVLLSASRAKEAVIVHLNPPDLGEMTIMVKSASQRVDAEITTSNDNVRQALQAHAGQLGQSLAQRGLELNSLNFGSHTNTSTQHGSLAHQNAPQGQQNARPQSGNGLAESKPNSQPIAFSATTQGVDLRI